MKTITFRHTDSSTFVVVSHISYWTVSNSAVETAVSTLIYMDDWQTLRIPGDVTAKLLEAINNQNG